MTKFEKAPSNEVDQYPEEIDEILQAMDINGAMVTDESIVWDFSPILCEQGEKELFVKDLSSALGISVDLDDSLLKLAKILRGRK